MVGWGLTKMIKKTITTVEQMRSFIAPFIDDCPISAIEASYTFSENNGELILHFTETDKTQIAKRHIKAIKIFLHNAICELENTHNFSSVPALRLIKNAKAEFDFVTSLNSQNK
jgi:hypothetical protein